MRIASGLEPRPAGYAGPENLFAFVSSVAKSGSNGVRFTYGSINTQALALVVERIERKPLAQVLSERIWQPLGMEGDADWSVDSVGTELAAGGLQPILRDMARFGEAMRLGGRFNGKQVIPASAVQSIRRGGRREDFAKAGYKLLPGWSYRSQWWVTHNAHGAFAARGIYGQAIYVDPAAEMVIARFASHPTSFNAALDPTTLPAFQAVAEHLMRRR